MTLTPPAARLTLPQRLMIALVLLALGMGLVLLARHLLTAPLPAKRQVARIKLLPDTPPPPPREEPKKEPPKEAPKQVRQEQPKPQQAPPPAAAPLKMEGAAGDGPSAFQAGTVTHELQAAPPVLGGSAPGNATASDRAQERYYANAVRQLLRDAIERHLDADAGELTASFALWVQPDGRIERYEVLPGGADAPGLNRALADTAQAVRLPPPGALAQPMRFRLTVRPQG